MAEQGMSNITKMALGCLLIVALAASVLVGDAVLDEYGYSLRNDRNGDVTDLTLGAVNTTTDVGTTGQYPYLQSITRCYNGSNYNISEGDYQIDEGCSDGGGIVLLDAGSDWATQVVNCSFVYKADTDASNDAAKFSTGLAIFATFIGIIVLTYVGKLVIDLIKGKK